MCEPRRLTTVWVSTACYRDSFTFFVYFTVMLLDIHIMESVYISAYSKGIVYRVGAVREMTAPAVTL
jgi:hypothetical protein